LSHAKTIARHALRNRRITLALKLLELEPVLRGIMTEVAAQHNLTRSDILPSSRHGKVMEVLHEFFYRALTETLASSVLIGDISARDHTTVLYGSARWAILHDLPIPRGAEGKRYMRFNQQKGASAHGA
jgi:chromosomal replication initiation ATPase DnaA